MADITRIAGSSLIPALPTPILPSFSDPNDVILDPNPYGGDGGGIIIVNGDPAGGGIFNPVGGGGIGGGGGWYNPFDLGGGPSTQDATKVIFPKLPIPTPTLLAQNAADAQSTITAARIWLHALTGIVLSGSGVTMANIVTGLLNTLITLITKEGTSGFEAELPQNASDLMADMQAVIALINQINNLIYLLDNGLLNPPSGVTKRDFANQLLDIVNDLGWVYQALKYKYDHI
jgi:hypothetical protein